jgi:ABC-2 type transport system ATP-binding protein
MIRFQNLTKYYSDVCAVNNVSFKIDSGEIVGFLGPNGAGKSTTYRILTGYLQATSGTIKVKDFDIHEDQLEIKKLIGYLPESAPIYHDMLVYDYLNYVADIRGVNAAKKIAYIKELAELCSLNEVMHKNVSQLSKGYRQRVGIAHALMGDPEILVLDEPTVGLDPNQIVETRDIIKRIGRQKTIILSTHILSEALATCDRFIIINHGKLVADLSKDEVLEKTRDMSFEDLFRTLTKGGN